MKHAMKYLVTTLAASLCLIIPAVSFASDNEALHFGVSTILGAAGETIIHHKTKMGAAERIGYGTVLGSLPGLAKEIIDSTKNDNHFSGKDMAANVAGAFVGSVIANWFNNKILVSVEMEQKKVALTVSCEF